jgi:hypothetical protein
MASFGCCGPGAPWRDLPIAFDPYTTCYNRFVRWRRAGVWSQIVDAIAAAHDAAVQMIDTSIVRVHQNGACLAPNRRQAMLCLPISRLDDVNTPQISGSQSANYLCAGVQDCCHFHQ